MYFNVFGEKVSRARYREMLNAQKNRREIIAAGLSRRELFKMGLLTSAGYLVAKGGLSARAEALSPVMQAASPSVAAFVQPMPIIPVKQAVQSLNPAPQVQPNTAGGEARTRPHQALTQFPPQQLYSLTQQAAQVSVHPKLPAQTLWTYDGISPGPTIVSHYGVPVLVRNFNQLPLASQNGGFGLPSVSRHLHNAHTPSESDGFPCDFFSAQNVSSLYWYDQHYPMQYAGVLSDHQSTGGDINEALSTLWYHDHRVGFTAQNTYKGLVGYHLFFNQFDSGDETTGFHLPSFPQFDIPMVFADKIFDSSGTLTFDMFALDGLLGDTFLVNGAVQPVLHVSPRRYRFRWLNVGPSRFYDLFITNLQSSNRQTFAGGENGNGVTVPFWLIANDGNLLPKPIQVTDATIGVAERVDVIVDFTQMAGQTLYIENRLTQTSGLGPDDPPVLAAPGQGNLLLKIIVDGSNVADNSVDPATIKQFYQLPDNTATPAVTRTFKFDRLNGMFSINEQFMDCDVVRFTVTQNTAEHWILTNLSGNWQHPIHIHLEEHQILSRNRAAPSNFEVSRKDVTRLRQNERIELFFRFRDWTGRYPLHCHNTVHEDHAMMLRWEIQPQGDTNRTP